MTEKCADRIGKEWEYEKQKLAWAVGAATTIRGENGWVWYGYDPAEHADEDSRGDIGARLEAYAEHLLCFEASSLPGGGQVEYYHDGDEGKVELDRGAGSQIPLRLWPHEPGFYVGPAGRILHLQFSWGGPSDGLVVFQVASGRWRWQTEKAIYYFKDWFDAAYHTVRCDSKAFQQIGQLVDWLIE